METATTATTIESNLPASIEQVARLREGEAHICPTKHGAYVVHTSGWSYYAPTLEIARKIAQAVRS